MTKDPVRSSADERELAELLTVLVEQYETRRHAIPKAAPAEVLQFLMEQHGFGAKDLWPIVGAKGITSEILSGKRRVGVATAARLGDLFHVPPDLFVDWESERAQELRDGPRRTSHHFAGVISVTGRSQCESKISKRRCSSRL